MRAPLRASALLLATLLLLSQACSHGETPQLIDGGGDLVADRTILPDVGSDRSVPPADTRVDRGQPPDTRPRDTLSPDIAPCGNGQLDDDEDCDPAILTGQPGACPVVADCNDQNPCTTDELVGLAAECTARCLRTPLPACCGNGEKEGTEGCDDGNKLDTDGCTNGCALPGGHLLITEFAVSPSEAEFIEIYNPGAATVSLENYYLADRFDYFRIPEGALASGSTDFVARFPAGATIEPGQYVVIAGEAFGFKATYARVPDYELKSSDSTVPDMVSAFAAPASSTIGSQAGLTDSGELLMLFTWDGAADLVQDVDYMLWKDSSATATSKNTLICIDGPDADSDTSCYLDDTLTIDQSSLRSPGQGGSLHRCNYHEQGETQSGGNGIGGHDETSEPFTGTWVRNPTIPANRTPGEAAPLGLCPIS